MPRLRMVPPLLLVILLAACSAGGPSAPAEWERVGPIDANCSPSAPPAGLGLSDFYTRYCDVAGIPVVASSAVPDAALQASASIVAQMLEPVPLAGLAALRDMELRVGVIGENQVTTDMPEYADLYAAFPGTDWDGSTRGLGGTRERPLTTSAEENLLCYPADPYWAESILVHEFAHTIQQYALPAADAAYAGRIEGAYDQAMAEGLWANTYAAADALEYWAEGVQSYFEVNASSDPSHGEVDTRAELAAHDPRLFELVDHVFDGGTVDAGCHSE